ncbi:MAG: CehA/McbA family metallohydrolase [Kiritimatiellae bacterium]|nr:CehA/McbA family metallohydrolase [Kiritimatiellia bacterium]
MSKRSGSTKTFGARTRTVDLSEHWNWPRRVPKEEWWQKLAERVGKQPAGDQAPWGIPFKMAGEKGPRVVLVSKSRPAVTIPVSGKADFFCLLHAWEQMPEDIHWQDPTEGLVVGEYEITCSDGSGRIVPVRARFEVNMVDSPGPAWLALPFAMPVAVDPTKPTAEIQWGRLQTGVTGRGKTGPLVYAMPNPCPEKSIRSLTLRGLKNSPLLIAGLTLYQGASHPLRHLPRRTYRVKTPGRAVRVERADVDLGTVTRVETVAVPRGKAWLKAREAGTQTKDPPRAAEDLLEVVAAEDATLSVRMQGQSRPAQFSVGEAFHKGKSRAGKASLEVLGKRRQWLQVRVIDRSTGRPTPTRIHFSGSRGEYLAPYGHHSQVNTNWFEDYAGDVVVGGRSYAYVLGEFPTDLPVGDVYVEIYKGFEYKPVRRKVTIRPGQRLLELHIDRWKDLRRQGWVTADTHVHFISPQTAWLEGQAEGVNVVNLLASQWGRLFTNVADYSGRVGVAEEDTIVYVGTENRNHMLGHMSMLGTQKLPVFPMCCGGPGEAHIGDPDFRTLAEWALENRRKGGLSIRPHYPYCGHTEDPVPILKGLVDALEINVRRAGGFPVQEWYRYLNCGYRVTCVGGTDKMSASTALGWQRTYAKLDPNTPFTYARWVKAVRAGRAVTTTGPLLDLRVEGRQMGDTIALPPSGGTLEAHATAECFRPLGLVELVLNGHVVAREEAPAGAGKLAIRTKLKVAHSGWIAARCWGAPGPAGYMAAHTSPIYLKCGHSRAFDGPAAEHMLALVEGGIEYLNTIATVFDEPSRKRMVKLFKEARAELKGRLIIEGGCTHHHGDGHYHTHGHRHGPPSELPNGQSTTTRS